MIIERFWKVHWDLKRCWNIRVKPTRGISWNLHQICWGSWVAEDGAPRHLMEAIPLMIKDATRRLKKLVKIVIKVVKKVLERFVLWRLVAVQMIRPRRSWKRRMQMVTRTRRRRQSSGESFVKKILLINYFRSMFGCITFDTSKLFHTVARQGRTIGGLKPTWS